MSYENVAISRLEEEARKVDRALKGLVLYRQLQNEPVVQAFKDFVAGLVTDGVCAGQLWDDYHRFVHCMMNALVETGIIQYGGGHSWHNGEPTVSSLSLGEKAALLYNDGVYLPGRSVHQSEVSDILCSCGKMQHTDDVQDMGCCNNVHDTSSCGSNHMSTVQGQGNVVGDFLWKAYWGYVMLSHETPFSRFAEHTGFEGVPGWLKSAMEFELENLRQIAMVDWNGLLTLARYKTNMDGWANIFDVKVFTAFEGEVVAADSLVACGGVTRPVPYYRVVNWGVQELAHHFYRNGSGMFGIFKGFRWERVEGRGRLKGIAAVDPITLDQLVGYEEQKAKLIENTELLLKGYKANNVLLYGDKGTGKSSLVKALVHRYADQGLRIVEVPKDCLRDYYQILENLEGRKQKFILFVDDLSFEEGEVEYKHIKALLEGGLKARPANVVVYATSNRRHLVREYHHDRIGTYPGQDDEISPLDSMQEKLSLSDRFGITLTFIAPNQRTYLEMVERLAASRGIEMDVDALREEALRWEKRYNGRSGRTARQFIDYLEAKLSDTLL